MEAIYKEPQPPPMPEWMEEYIDRATPAVKPDYLPQKARPRSWRPEQTEGAYAVRPLGAQAELDPEQMKLLGAYAAWTGAGAPTKYSEGALTAMSDWQGKWQQQAALSESLFPRQTKLRANWRTALQR